MAVDVAWFKSKALRALWHVAVRTLPLRWHLPLRHRISVAREAERELVHLKNLGPNTGVAVDVGANIGVYSYGLSRLYDHVYAFEINPQLLTLLRAYRSAHIDVIPKGLSSQSGKAVLHVPQVRNQDLTGWATLSPDVYPTVAEFRRIPVETVTLDSYNLEDVRFIKMDVEGHEPAALEGARETIRRCRPHVLIEIKPQHLRQVHAFFDELGYDIRRLNQIVDAEPSGNNFIFIPGPLP